MKYKHTILEELPIIKEKVKEAGNGNMENKTIIPFVLTCMQLLNEKYLISIINSKLPEITTVLIQIHQLVDHQYRQPMLITSNVCVWRYC